LYYENITSKKQLDRLIEAKVGDAIKKDFRNEKVKNPKTNRQIKVTTALADKNHPAYQTALKLVKSKRKETSDSSSKIDLNTLNDNDMKNIISKSEKLSSDKVGKIMINFSKQNTHLKEKHKEIEKQMEKSWGDADYDREQINNVIGGIDSKISEPAREIKTIISKSFNNNKIDTEGINNSLKQLQKSVDNGDMEQKTYDKLENNIKEYTNSHTTANKLGDEEYDLKKKKEKSNKFLNSLSNVYKSKTGEYHTDDMDDWD